MGKRFGRKRGAQGESLHLLGSPENENEGNRWKVLNFIYLSVNKQYELPLQTKIHLVFRNIYIRELHDNNLHIVIN